MKCDTIPFFSTIEKELDQEISAIEAQGESAQRTAEMALHAAKSALDRLINFLSENPFGNTMEEIHCFREIGPKITSKFIFYMKMYLLELRRSLGNQTLEKKLLKKELKGIEKSIQHHESFYRYYKSGATHLDEKYFLRAAQDLYSVPEVHYGLIDTRYQTPHGYLAAEFLANEQYSRYLLKELDLLEGRTGSTNGKAAPGADINWTATKAALGELIYGLYVMGVFNNGNALVKDIVEYFEKTLGISVGNVYRMMQEIRIRKKGRTIFLREMLNRLERRMDEADENPRF